MNWTQIADGWAEMTGRLRGDTGGAERHSGRPRALDRETSDGTGDISFTSPVETAFADHSRPSGR